MASEWKAGHSLSRAQIAKFMGPTWGPSGPLADPMNLAIRGGLPSCNLLISNHCQYNVWKISVVSHIMHLYTAMLFWKNLFPSVSWRPRLRADESLRVHWLPWNTCSWVNIHFQYFEDKTKWPTFYNFSRKKILYFDVVGGGGGGGGGGRFKTCMSS